MRAGEVVARVVYEPEPSAPAAARRFVRDTLQAWVTAGAAADGHGLIDDAVLLTSELVTNAVVHAGTQVQVTCRLVEGGVEVMVSDGQPADVIPDPPRGGHVPAERTDGRGLLLPSALASAWGVTYGRSAKAVWFRLKLAGAAGEPLPGGEGPGHDGPGHDGPQAALADPDALSAVAGRDGAPAWPAPQGEPGYGELLATAVGSARASTGADAAYAVMVGEDGDLGLRAAVGAPPQREETEPGTRPGTGAPPGMGAPPEAGARAAPGAAARGRAPTVRAAPGSGLAGGGEPGMAPAVVTVPFIVDGRVTGLLSAVAGDGRRFGDRETLRLQWLADRWGAPLERARMRDLARVRRGRIGALAEARGLLTGGLSQDEALDLAGRVIVPRLAPWCGVLLREESRLRTAFARHVDGDVPTSLGWLLDQVCEVVEAGVASLWLPAADGPGWCRPVAVPARAGVPAGAGAAPAAGAVWCVPLGQGGDPGVLAVGGWDGRIPREVAELVADIAARIGIALVTPALVRQRNGPAAAVGVIEPRGR